MAFLSSDLTRNFTIGFFVGALIVGAGAISEHGATLESPARAATPIEAPQPGAEFLIEPIEAAE